MVSNLPAEKQEMIERLHRSDEDGGKTVLVDDDPRNIFALSSILEGDARPDGCQWSRCD